jgi:hypothetical protein
VSTADRYNASRRVERLHRKVTGQCVAASCPEMALDDSERCGPHRDQHRASARGYWRRKRDERLRQIPLPADITCLVPSSTEMDRVG